MQKLIKDNVIVDDNWQIVAKTDTVIPAGAQLLLPYSLWSQQADAVAQREDIGVWFDSDELPTSEQATALGKLALIAIHFPVFTDGRGFSIARLLRERMGYRGELRAFGHVIRDQLCYMKRCGFNSFILKDNSNLQAALASLDDFTEYYQNSVDQPLPLFRRQS